MPVEKYFTLEDSISYLSKRFKVIQEGYEPMLVRAETIQHTLDGLTDASRGPIYEIHRYLIRVPAAVAPGSEYGTLDDLEQFFRLNNPNGSPTDILTMTDHYGVAHHVLFTGEWAPKILSALVEGVDSSFIVQCVFQFLNDNFEGS